MHIVVADDLPRSALDLLAVDGWTLDAKSGRSLDELKAAVATADAIVVRSATKVTAEVIAAAPRLRAIARAGTGVDNVDVEAASARGVVVMNAPGANSISVAELAMGMLLALARKLPAADASMKTGKWDKKAFLGEEVRGKTLGLVGFGRIGQEVARRALAFDMQVVTHDPFISAEVARDRGAVLVDLDALCANADYISLHLPVTAQTRRLFDAARLARCKKGVRIINTARGELVDEAALAEAIGAGHIGGAALDVFTKEPTVDHTLQMLPQVVAAPHVAASTREGQELVGIETATALCDFLRTGLIRNAVNYPSLPPDEYQRLQPFVQLGSQLGQLLGQLDTGRVNSVSVEYYGELTGDHHPVVANAVLVGLFQSILSEPVTEVNAAAVAQTRGIAVSESQSSRPRPFTNLLAVIVSTTEGERRAEGTVMDGVPRLVRLDDVRVEAPLRGTLLVIGNHDQPGVIGEVGTILGRHGVNIASFALGRADGGAVGVINLDDAHGEDGVPAAALQEIAAVPAVKSARVVQLAQSHQVG